MILEFALLLVYMPLKKNQGKFSSVICITFVSGLALTPLLSSVFNMAGGASIVAQAFLMTSVAFGGISMFAMTTKKRF